MAARLSLAQAFIQFKMEGDNNVVAGIRAMNAKVQQALSPLTSAFNPAKNGILAMVQAASPQAFNTLSGSFRLLSMSIGSAFIPQVVEASKLIQQLASYIRSIDPELKKQIAMWVGYGVAVLGAAVAFSKLLGFLALISANPVTATLLAGITAVVAVVSILNGKLSETARMLAEVATTSERMRQGVYTEGEYNRSAAAAIEGNNSMTNEEKIAKAKELHEKLRQESIALANKANSMGQGEALANSAKGLMGGVNPAREMEAANAIKVKEAAMLEDMIGRLQQKKGGPKFTNKADIDKASGKGDFLTAGVNSGMGGGAGSITSLENAFSQTASAALAADEIQQKILQETMLNGKTFQEAVTNTKKTADILQRMSLP